MNVCLVSDLFYSKTCSVRAAGRSAAASLGWWSLASGLAMFPPWHTAGTWGSVEGVGVNKTETTRERGIFDDAFLKPNLKSAEQLFWVFFPTPR